MTKVIWCDTGACKNCWVIQEVHSCTKATKVLRNEHEVILRVLKAPEAAANAIESGVDASAQFLSNVVEFLRLYADRQPHGKEEDLLFPELEKKGMPWNGGRVGVMLMEHQFGQVHIAKMAEAACRRR